MPGFSWIFLSITLTLLVGCTLGKPAHHPDASSTQGYFDDANQCRQSSVQKQLVQIPAGGAMMSVEVPTGYDASGFMACMVRAGRPVAPADLTEFTQVSTTCLQESQGKENHDQSYADCINRSQLKIEILDRQ